MSTLTTQVCFNHANREPVARCTNCRHFFCRECILEHDSRMLCAKCVTLLSQPKERRRGRFIPVLRTVQLGLSFLLLWFFFYVAGALLLSIPSSFHEGTFWQTFRVGTE